ncbi:hypothetical protein ACSBR2_024846 [Camellia fascicularis]
MNDSTASGNQIVPPKPEKKKRNLPGMPDPDSEVIALSPKSLLATNRFVCEICSKGFQRDQNLQLHRRGHNLPWKLRQKSSKEVRKRVYVCPETSCVHHDPSRALGDLTGIKKHFCRKHGEKKWKCDKCSKKYAVQSDWKAHSKVCGTKEYKCDCGTLFSRRDSFITHRAFCDALAEESTKAVAPHEDSKIDIVASSPPSLRPTAEISSVLPIQNSELRKKANLTQILDDAPVSGGNTSSVSSNGSTSSSVFGSLFASSTNLQPQPAGFTNLIRSMSHPERVPDLTPSSSTEPVSLCLNTNHGSSIFGTAGQELKQYAPLPHPAMSATALLQKAAQMGAAVTNSSSLRGFGIASSTSSGEQDWDRRQIQPESGSDWKELMLGTQSVFGPKQTILDLLGLGMAAGSSPTSGLSALMTSIGGGGFDMATATAATYGGGEFSGKDMERRS